MITQSRQLGAALVLLTISSAAPAQNAPVELTDLSLKELLTVQVIRPESKRAEDGPSHQRWRIGYRFIQTRFYGYLDGRQKLSFEDVLEKFPVVPVEIDQEAHISEFAFQATDRVTLILLVPFIRQRTYHIRRSGAPFAIESEGLGDISVSAAYLFWGRGPHRLQVSGGFNLPTGSIDRKGETPRGPNTQLPYTMQIGSGTLDLSTGLTYGNQRESFQWGGQILSTIRTGRNSRSYRLGNRILLSGWIGHRPLRWLDLSVKSSWLHWGRINGSDPVLNPNLAPVANSRLYGGRRVDVSLGVKFLPRGFLRGHVFEFEAGLPAYQSLTGPQPKEARQLSATWRLGL